MPVIIDRRLNPGGKSTNNRQKFLQRARDSVKKSIKEAINSGKGLKDIGNGEKIKVKSGDLEEPVFQNDPTTGKKTRVLSGNSDYEQGDVIEKPSPNGGRGSGQGDPDMPDGRDSFEFILTREEFLDVLFDDLELPDLVKKNLSSIRIEKFARAGFTNQGSPSNLNIEKTFQKSLGRRIALKRPTDSEIEELDKQISEAEEPELSKLIELKEELESKRRRVAFIEETDLRYNHWEKRSEPSTSAVMFCLMDVSGSMGEKEKDVAKRFFLLLYLFLEKKYEQVTIHFIRHTTEAEEVDEKTFFYDAKSGGTTVSSGLRLIMNMIKEKYSDGTRNLYVAQVSDGDNWAEDNVVCEKLLKEELLPALQYMCYVQISEIDRGDPVVWGMMFPNPSYSIWPTYYTVAEDTPNFAVKKVKDKNQIWQVFVELFEKEQ